MSLIHACIGDNNGRTDIVGVNENCQGGETAIDWIKNVFAGTGLAIDRASSGATLSIDDGGASTAKIANNAVTHDKLSNDVVAGWNASDETWTYASSDSPSFTFTISGDKTSKYSPGMRVKLTQTTVKYFIITMISYSSPNTTITVYGGTDYSLVNASITNPFFSTAKAPQGFPLNPAKWTVEVSDATDRGQLSPTQNTWYNLGSVYIDIPIGVWKTSYTIALGTNRDDTGHAAAVVTLSTANNSESDSDFSSLAMTSHPSTDSNVGFIYAPAYKEKILNLTSTTRYYINTAALFSGQTDITNDNSVHKLFIRAVSSYL